jgi:hypothetical protein
VQDFGEVLSRYHEMNEAGKVEEAAKFLFNQHEQIVANRVLAETQKLVDEKLATIAPVLEQATQRQNAEKAYGVFKQVMDAKVGDEPLYPELQDADFRMEVGRFWQARGFPPTSDEVMFAISLAKQKREVEARQAAAKQALDEALLAEVPESPAAPARSSAPPILDGGRSEPTAERTPLDASQVILAPFKRRNSKHDAELSAMFG